MYADRIVRQLNYCSQTHSLIRRELQAAAVCIWQFFHFYFIYVLVFISLFLKLIICLFIHLFIGGDRGVISLILLHWFKTSFVFSRLYCPWYFLTQSP